MGARQGIGKRNKNQNHKKGEGEGSKGKGTQLGGWVAGRMGMGRATAGRWAGISIYGKGAGEKELGEEIKVQQQSLRHHTGTELGVVIHTWEAKGERVTSSSHGQAGSLLPTIIAGGGENGGVGR